MADSRPQSGVWLDESYRRVNERASEAGSIVVVPVGSLEQHGYHLPCGTDTILCEAVAQEGVSRVVEDVPVVATPTVWTGFSPHHTSLGGTITVSSETLESLLEDVLNSALENGFDAALLLNGHGGNKSLIDTVVRNVGVDHPEAEILGLTYFDLARAFEDEIREGDVGSMAHAGEFETALMQYLFPDLVDESDMTARNWEEPYDLGVKDLIVGGPLTVHREVEDRSASGALGAPDLADAETGERIFTGVGEALAELLREIHERNR